MERMLPCDLNCDLGEGIGNDEAIMPFITSASIACGGHAGDKDTMKRTVDRCLEYNVYIGAHPSYPDKDNFGRIDLLNVHVKHEDLYGIVAGQVGDLLDICLQAGARLHHVKPHGALYNRAAWDGRAASFICRAVKEADSSLVLYGLSGSRMKTEAESHGLTFRNEVFADRTYQDDGSLTPRSQPNALVEDAGKAVQQVLQMIGEHTVQTVSGSTIPILAETICIHGDGKHAVTFAKKIYEALSWRSSGH